MPGYRASTEDIAARREAVAHLTQEGFDRRCIARRLGVTDQIVADDRRWLRNNGKLPGCSAKAPRAARGWPRPNFDKLPPHIRAVVEREDAAMRARGLA